MSPHKRFLVPTSEAADLLGVKKTKLFELMALHELETVLLGRRRMIVYDSIGAYVDRLRAQANTAKAA